MDRNVEFLNYIYQNAQMGTESTQQLLDTVADKQTKEHLKFQNSEYNNILQEAKSRLYQIGKEEKDINAMEKIMSKTAIGMKTMMDQSPAHIAEMMIQGSTMGVIDIMKNLKKYEGCMQENVALGKRLLKLEEDSVEQWKKYLNLTTV